MKYQVVLFDLDGTLTDPGEGITNSVAYSLKRYGIKVENRSELYKFIGPPLIESYEKYYGFSHEQAVEAVEIYREYYADKGIYENEVYTGIEALLRKLKEQKILCLVATSKPELYAREIIRHFRLEDYFYYVAGANMDESRTNKAEVIAYALAQLPEEINTEKIIMVGDRLHDIRGARENGLDSIGVLFGYGSEEELKQAGATYLVKKPEQVFYILDR